MRGPKWNASAFASGGAFAAIGRGPVCAWAHKPEGPTSVPREGTCGVRRQAECAAGKGAVGELWDVDTLRGATFTQDTTRPCDPTISIG